MASEGLWQAGSQFIREAVAEAMELGSEESLGPELGRPVRKDACWEGPAHLRTSRFKVVVVQPG